MIPQFLTPTTGTVFHALSDGVTHFVQRPLSDYGNSPTAAIQKVLSTISQVELVQLTSSAKTNDLNLINVHK